MGPKTIGASSLGCCRTVLKRRGVSSRKVPSNFPPKPSSNGNSIWSRKATSTTAAAATVGNWRIQFIGCQLCWDLSVFWAYQNQMNSCVCGKKMFFPPIEQIWQTNLPDCPKGSNVLDEFLGSSTSIWTRGFASSIDRGLRFQDWGMRALHSFAVIVIHRYLLGSVRVYHHHHQ